MPRILSCALLLAVCGCRDSSDAPPLTVTSMSWGRLVDVYGWRTAGGLRAPERVAADVVVGPLAGEPGTDAPGFHYWLPRDPGTLHERLLIDAEIDSRPFAQLMHRLGRDLRPVDSAPVARDAALVVDLSRDPQLPPDFFFRRAPGGALLEPANAEAIQLLDPSDPARPPLPIRIVARGARIVIDPWLAADEADAWGLPVRAGLPAPPPRSERPNVRLAIAVEGPAAIPGLSGDGADGATSGGHRAHVLDFRAARDDENAPFVRSGHVPERVPPRLLGQLALRIAEVDAPANGRQRVRVYKDGAVHDIDAGDVLRVQTRDGFPLGATEVLAEPTDDRGQPEVAFVDVIVRALDGLDALDTRGDPGRPTDPAALADWLTTHAASGALQFPYDDRRAAHEPDDWRWFVRFVPGPLPSVGSGPTPPGTGTRPHPDRNLSPFVECVVQFDEPIGLGSIRPHDTFLIAMRDVLDHAALLQDLVTARGIDPATVPIAKLVTPFLVASRLTDLRGDGTSFRLSPLLGLHLDDRMRREDGPRAFEDQRYRYYALVQAGRGGVRDRGGNALEIEGADHVAVPFALDLRRDTVGPQQPDNLVAYAVRRFEDADEDERPSLFRDDEVVRHGQAAPADALPVPDWFGAHVVADGHFHARPTARLSRFVDDRNQPPPPPQSVPSRHCPEQLAGDAMIPRGSAQVRFGTPVVNPVNPAGARLQTVWREIDMGLAHDDPQDMDLDVEAMSWAPHPVGPLLFDVLHGASLFLGHSEWRPEPCIGSFTGLPELPASGLKPDFANNYAHDVDPATGVATAPAPHRAFDDHDWTIDPNEMLPDPTGTYGYLPLPEFEEPYFTWRDQTLAVQGGNSGRGSDVRNANQVMDPYLLSPFAGGRGRQLAEEPRARVVEPGHWLNTTNFQLAAPTRVDQITDGLVGAIALPLLADFRVDGSQNEVESQPGPGGGGGADLGQYRGPGDVIIGRTGWATSIAATSSPHPDFRAYSGGFVGSGALPPVLVTPADAAWHRAAGGYTPVGQRTAPVDNSVFWTAFRFLKRRTVSTAGFVDLLDPHRIDPAVLDDPRLARRAEIPAGSGVNVVTLVEAPPVVDGATIDVELRVASEVDPEPWIWREQGWREELRPSPTNFPLDPRKAGDAGLRKWDDRPAAGGLPRNGWAYPYNRVVSAYTADPALLEDRSWLRGQAGPNDGFAPEDVRYLNWRLVIRNGEADGRPVEPRIDTFAVAWRIEPLR